MRGAHQYQRVAGALGIHRHAALRVFHDADARDQQRGWNLDGATILGRELVVQRILAAHERRAIRQRCVQARLGRAHQTAHVARVLAAWPAEVVQDRDARRIRAHAHQIAHTFVDGRQTHPIWIGSKPRCKAVRDGHTLLRAGHRLHHRRITRRTVLAHQRLDHAATLHLVVVLANDPRLAGDVGVRQQRLQRFHKARHGRGGRRCHGPLQRGPRRIPHRFARRHGNGVLQELRRDAAHLGAVPQQHQIARRRAEGAQLAHLHAMFIRERAQRGDATGRNRQHHALLRFADPHLGGRQARVLQRCAIQMHRGPQHATHLAHRARESTRATIGHAVEQRPTVGVASRQQRIQRLLLRDRCANLHRVAEFVGVRVGQFGAGERRAVNAITTRAASQHHDHVTLARRTTDERARHQAHHAAVHQRIAHVAWIEPHRPVQGWNAHAVAVVAHTLHHLSKDASGLQATLGHLHVGRCHAEHVDGGDGLRGKAGAHHVSNASTDAGGRTTIGLDRARVVVRLHLDAHGMRFIEGDHARVVHEHAQAPVDGARLRRIHQLMRGGGHGVLQQVVHHQRVAVARMPRGQARARKQRWRARRKALFGVAHAALQRLVNAVLAPGLRDGLQLDLARLAALAAVLRLHGTHLVQV